MEIFYLGVYMLISSTLLTLFKTFIPSTLFFIFFSIFFYKKSYTISIIFSSVFLIYTFLFVSLEEIDISKSYRARVSNGRVISLNNKKIKADIYFNHFKDSHSRTLDITLSHRDNYYSIKDFTPIKKDVSKVRHYILKKVTKSFSGLSRDNLDFYKGIILGDKYSLSDSIVDTFRNLGISHLLVVSGLHIGIILGFLSIFFESIPISKPFRGVGILLFLSLYILALPRTPSIIRSYIMATSYILGDLLYEKGDSKKSLIFAMCISIFLDPFSIKRISFLMSYTSVFTIIFLYSKFSFKGIKNPLLQRIVSLIILSLTLQVFLMPIAIFFFRRINLLSPIYNLLLVPIGSLYVEVGFIGLFLSFIFLGWITAPTLSLLYTILLKGVSFFTHFNLGSFIYKGRFTLLFLIFSYGIFLFFLLTRKRLHSLLLILILIFTSFLPRRAPFKGDGVEFSIVDGSSILTLNKVLSRRDIYTIYNKGISSIDIIISSTKQQKYLEKFIPGDIYLLEENKGIEVNGKRYYNIGGRILLL